MGKTAEDNLNEATTAYQRQQEFIAKAIAETRIGSAAESDTSLTENVVLTGKIRRNVPKKGSGKGKG